MGDANKRGDFEERKRQSIERTRLQREQERVERERREDRIADRKTNEKWVYYSRAAPWDYRRRS